MEEKNTLTNPTSIEAKEPVGHTIEELIDPETSFDDLLIILSNRPEAAAAEEVEQEEKEREAKTARLKAVLGRDYSAYMEGQTQAKPLKKAKRRPGAIQLRTEVARIAVKEIGADGRCEVFANGYGIYDNGDRKTVVWVPDCGSITYRFTKLRESEKQYQSEKATVGRDTLGPEPWYIAVMLRGEDSIEFNLDHPRSVGTMSDSGEKEDYEVEPASHWAAGCHFDNPEEAYIRKEAEEERRAALTAFQLQAYDLYYNQNYTEEQTARLLGVSRRAIRERLSKAKRKLEAEPQKYFSVDTAI